MPADWQVIRQDAIALNSLKAASDAHPEVTYDAVQQRAKREGWPVGNKRRGQPAKEHAIDRASKAAIANGSTSVAVVRSEVVRTEPGDQLAKHLHDTGEATRASLAGALRRAASHAETLPPSQSLKQARSVHEVAKAAALVHSWQGSAAPQQGVLMLSQVNISLTTGEA